MSKVKVCASALRLTNCHIALLVAAIILAAAAVFLTATVLSAAAFLLAAGLVLAAGFLRMLGADAELIDADLSVFLPGFIHGAREILVVHGVRIILGLDSQGMTEIIALAILSDTTAVEEIATIELHARLVAQYLHDDAGTMAVYGADITKLTLCGGIHTPVMVETAADSQVRILKSDIAADKLRLTEIERSSLH